MSETAGADGRAAPDDLLELAAEQLLAASPHTRNQVLADLVARYPSRDGALRQLAHDLGGAERLLDHGYRASTSEPAAPQHPDRIGDYAVQRVIGQGAFGVVYLCTQHTPVRRDVAVKVLRPGAGDRSTLDRFAAERQFLASLQHPAIAKLFDAGLMPDGRPYFVMEFVPGHPISAYCDQRELPVEARIELFVRLCRGVQHAHEQGVVHRDLKPGNVLVFEQDGQGQPKIIDFGIARLLQPTDAGNDTPRTETGRVVGTPGYMSPEQLAGRPGEIDARTDVFALGVILYELLTGELPWGRQAGTSYTEPARPSSRVATDGARTAEAARRRGCPTHRLASRLRGDLDWIALQALAFEKERRYASAQALLEDLQSHLQYQPIRARPPTLGYRLRKFARRRRAALAVGTGAVVAGLALWLSAVHWSQSRASSLMAEEAIARLLARANDPSMRRTPNASPLREALIDDALSFYEQFLRERPTDLVLRHGRARTLGTLVEVQLALAQYQSAEATGREVVAEHEALLALEPHRVARRAALAAAHRQLGTALYSLGRRQAGLEAMRQCADLLARCHAEAPATYGRRLAAALVSCAQAAGLTDPEYPALLQRACDLIDSADAAGTVDPNEPHLLLEARLAMLRYQVATGARDEAAVWLQRAETEAGGIPEVPPHFAVLMEDLAAKVAELRGNMHEAIDRTRRRIAIAERWSATDRESSIPIERLVEAHSWLGHLLYATDANEDSLASHRRAVELCETLVTRFPEHTLARGMLSEGIGAWAYAAFSSGRRSQLVDVEPYARRSVELMTDLRTAVDERLQLYGLWQQRGTLGLVLDALGRADAGVNWEATHAAMSSWRGRYEVDPVEAMHFVEYSARVARHFLQSGRDAEASAELDLAVEMLQRHDDGRASRRIHAADVYRLRMLLAVRAGNLEALPAEVEGVLAMAAGWHGMLAAADGTAAAWQRIRGDAGAAADAADHRDRAIDYYRAAIDELQVEVGFAPDWLWSVVPLAQARIRLAEALVDRGDRDVRELVEQAVQALTEVRDEVHVDRWDEAVFATGQRLLRQ